jgi:beta-glucosidase
MTRTRTALVSFAAALLLSNAVVAVAQNGGDAGPRPAYLDPSLPIDRRVDDLVSRMTVEEKATQFTNTSAAIPRLGVPAYNWWSEGLHGVGFDGVATVFPQAVGLAATFDTALMHRVATAISTEGRARYEQAVRENRRVAFEGLTFWSPNVNIFRDPRWGRGQETYGEDPYLTSRMGVAFVTGMQGDDPKYLRVVATPKHFAVHSGPEPTRHVADVAVSKHDMADTYLPAFRATVVEGKARSVMCAYNSINGEPACANPFLLKDILRGAWGFDGYVVSDCGAITDIRDGHKFVKTQEEAAAVSIRTGTDNDCDLFGLDTPAYLAAMKSGLVSPAEVDTALKRLFRARFELGQFDPPAMVKYAGIPFSENDSEAHRALALDAARSSMVLLKNDGVLPLRDSTKRIAVIGPLGDQVRVLLGNYNGLPSRATTVLDGLRRQFPKADVTFASGTKFLRYPFAVPPSAFTSEAGTPGLTATYFRTKDLSGEAGVTRVDPQLSFGFAANRLPDGFVAKEYSARWTGALTAPETATYTLTFRGAGGVRLWLDGKPVFDDWKEAVGNPFAAPERKAELKLEKGKRYAFKAEYFRSALPQGDSFIGMFLSGLELAWTREAGDDAASALATVKDADVVVAVVGISSDLEGEEMNRADLPAGFKGGDRTSLDLPKDEEDLIKAAKATGKPLVVVLMNGSALGVNWAAENANAILEAWYPGEEGGAAVAETLAGANNPAGRLPVTFYRSVDDLPPFEDYSMKARTYRYYTGPVLYPFGYGLSYSTFEYGNLKLSTPRVTAGAPLDVEVDVKNSSARAGDEVAQLYVSFPGNPAAPVRALRGFKRVRVAPGATERVRFTLDARDLSWVNPEGERLVSGPIRIHVGGGQPADGRPGVDADVAVDGERKLPD